MTDTLNTIIESLNPTNTSWNSAGSIAVLILNWVFALAVAGAIIYAVVNIKKIGRFLNDTLSELRKVEWLSGRQTYQYSLITLTVIFLFVLFVLGVDELLLGVRNLLLLRS